MSTHKCMGCEKLVPSGRVWCAECHEAWKSGLTWKTGEDYAPPKTETPPTEPTDRLTDLSS